MRMFATLPFMALLLAACGTSPAARFHTLSVAAGRGEKPPSTVHSVTVAAVHIPRALDRRQMVTQTGANSVEISDRDRWSAPLGDMARRVLSENLQAQWPDGVVVMPDMPPAPDTAQIVVSLVEFGPKGDGNATVGSWSLSKARTDEILIRRNVSFSTNVSGPGGDAAAAAMSKLLGQLATNIATTLAPAGRSS